jgi:hypothetical protein
MTVREFLELDNEDDILKLKAVKESIKGRNFIGNKKCRQLIDLSYWKVLSARKYYNEGNVQYLISLLLGIGGVELMRMDYKPFMYFLKWVEVQLERIGKLEEHLNKTEDEDFEQNAKLEAAGIVEMQKFEELNVIRELADYLDEEKVYQRSYKSVYTELLRNKTKARIQKRYQELSKPKK